MKRTIPILSTTVALAGCFAPGGGGGGGGGGTPPTSTPTTTPTTAPPTDPGTGEPGSEPLMLNISIHVEGYQEEQRDGGEAVFDAHVAAILGLADAADGGDGADPGDAKLTFELSPIFVNATVKWGSDIISQLDARGHGIGVHADLGGQGYVDLTDFTNDLIAMREAIEAQGVDVVHVSGICSPSEWVEAAIAAGFTATTGMVEYCHSSYPGAYPLPCGELANECHDQAVTDWEHMLHPWHTSDSADWLTDDPNGDLLLVANGAPSVSCLREDTAGVDCQGVTDSTDLSEFETVLREFIGHREAGVVNALTFSWSVGRPPTSGFADSLFAMVEEYVALGQVEWSTMEDIVAAAD